VDSLREFGILILVVLFVCFLWHFLIRAILRFFGVHIPFGFSRRCTNYTALRALGKHRYIFIRGVVLWGWPVFVAMEIFNYLTDHFQTDKTLRATIGRLAISLLIWSAGGVWFGWMMWNKSTTPNDIVHPAN
jgi:hypothetical protein